jgi:Spy/CpxP family protein refolding chaperone
MGRSMKALLGVVCAAGLLALGAHAAAAQGRAVRPNIPPAAPDEAPGVTPAEIQRMFDAYALMQAQEQLKIGDDQFTKFLTRFKALQEVRRQTLNERGRIINMLRRMLNQGAPESELRDRLNELQELDVRAAADTRKAYDAINQVLDVQQQAKFRVFEELMERRKLELVMRARQANRPKL